MMQPDPSGQDLMLMEEVAERLRIPVKTLKDWRLDGIGPPGVKIGRRVKFRRRDVDAWIDAQFAAVDTPEGQADPCSTTTPEAV
jgi:excisionase family DNA binding protein